MLNKWFIYVISVYVAIFLYYHFSPPGTALFQRSGYLFSDIYRIFFASTIACPIACVSKGGLSTGIAIGLGVGILSGLLTGWLHGTLFNTSLFAIWTIPYFTLFFLTLLIKKTVKHRQQLSTNPSGG